MNEHYTRVVVRKYGTLGGNGNIPNTLDEMIAALSAARDEIPEEYRTTAEVDCSPDCEFGEYYDAMMVYYCRPENEQEKAARVDDERRAAKRRAAQAQRDLEIAQERLRELST
jgi:hypothetical protein